MQRGSIHMPPAWERSLAEFTTTRRPFFACLVRKEWTFFMALLLVFIGIIFIDQTVKFWIITNLVAGQALEFIPGIISITRVHNTGVAFSLLSGVSGTILALVSVVIVLIIVILMVTKVIKGGAQRWALIFVVAGAISNALDRLVSGYVVDMFKFEFITFGIFNVADICIVCGIIAFAILWLMGDSGKRDPAENKKKGGSGKDIEDRTKPDPAERSGGSSEGNRRKNHGYTGEDTDGMKFGREYDLPVDGRRDRSFDTDGGNNTEKKFSLDEILEEFYRDSDDK